MTQRIVVCDDEPHITRAVSMKLTRAGFDVKTAANGQAAWEIIQEQTPSLLVTDFQMPRMGGFELIRRLRSQPATSDMPVILLTAKGFELDEQELKDELWISHLVMKPFSPRELLAIVQELVVSAEPART